MGRRRGQSLGAGSHQPHSVLTVNFLAALRGKLSSSRCRSALQLSFAAVLIAATQIVATSASSAAKLKSIDVKSIIAHDYALNNASNTNLSYALQASHEAGSALVMDDATFRAAKLSGYKTLEGVRYYPFYGTVTASSVPAQTSYPATFVAIMKQKSAPGTPSAYRSCSEGGGILVEQKDSSSSPWRAILEPSVAQSSSIPAFSKSSSGHGLLASGGSYALKIASLPTTMVAALSARARTDAGGALLPASDFAYGHCGTLGLADPHRDVGVQRGLELSFRASTITPSDVTAYQTKGGGALAVFTLREEVSEKPVAANQYIIWGHGATPWWSLLPIGHYASVSWTTDQELAVYVPSATSTAKARVVGGYAEVVAVTGTPVA